MTTVWFAVLVLSIFLLSRSGYGTTEGDFEDPTGGGLGERDFEDPTGGSLGAIEKGTWRIRREVSGRKK